MRPASVFQAMPRKLRRRALYAVPRPYLMEFLQAVEKLAEIARQRGEELPREGKRWMADLRAVLGRVEL